MRGSIVVLALMAAPFVASAQGHSPKRTDVPLGAKCVAPDRGNSSNVTASTTRVDPTTRGNKNCPAPTQGGSPGAVVGHSFITGTLFNDPDGTSMYDPSSMFGLSGWTVQLTGPAGVQTATTDGNGAYSFSNLDAGSYTLCVVPPGGWINTAPTSGSPCPGSSYGYQIDAPAGLSFDVYFSDYNFGFKSAPW
jgi:hypothetical protein